ncbi:flagellar biosynthesis protein FlhB [Paenibacillus larvae subsp. larvae B-3650]|nr:flagellar biosynthesis protein FlhB [Paenibacillus larvae subsp. larvae B-3650]
MNGQPESEIGTRRVTVSRYRLQVDLQLFSGEKTEKATPKKREEAKKKGQVAKSMEIPASLILFFTFLGLLLFSGFMKDRLLGLVTYTLEHDLVMNVTLNNVQMMFLHLIGEAFLLLAPIFIISVVIAFFANYAQIGFLFTGEPLKMKFNKINPIEGAKRIFSLRAIIDFLKSTIKMIVIAAIVWMTIWGEKDKLISLGHVPLQDMLPYIGSLTVQLGLKIGGVLIAIAALDYMYQKFEYEKSLRMSKQEIKDEFKKSEGDPLIKGKIRERQRRMAMQRMMQEVPKADVIITNPTHFAVALRYDAAEMEAPAVIAKGTDLIALKIKEVAKENGVTIMENKPLARALYAQVEIGQAIPADLFQAVAEVLAYVYKAKGRKM